MALRGTDPESHITQRISVYVDTLSRRTWGGRAVRRWAHSEEAIPSQLPYNSPSTYGGCSESEQPAFELTFDQFRSGVEWWSGGPGAGGR